MSDKDEVERREIPTAGTRLKYSVSYVKGIVGITGALGIYTASENGVKHSYAELNK